MSEFLSKLGPILEQETFGFGDCSIDIKPLDLKESESVKNSEFEVVSHFHLLPLVKSLGRLFIQEGLFSHGQDFTHDWTSKKDHKNKSWLYRLWSAESNLSHHSRMQCWTILNQKEPIGIAVLEQTDDSGGVVGKTPLQDLGALSVYLKPSYRGQGIMKAVVKDFLVPFLRKEVLLTEKSGQTPFIGAEDAAQTLIQRSLIDCSVHCLVVPFHHKGKERDVFLQDALKGNPKPSNTQTPKLKR